MGRLLNKIISCLIVVSFSVSNAVYALPGTSALRPNSVSGSSFLADALTASGYQSYAKFADAMNIDSAAFTDDERLAAKLIFELGQAQLFDDWQKAGIDTQAKKIFLAKIFKADQRYPGGLKQYLVNAKKLFNDQQAGKSRFDNFVGSKIENVATISLESDRERFSALQEQGLKSANKTAYVIVYGGIGQRLGVSGINKLGMAVDLISYKSYLQKYIEWILTAQERSNQINKESREVPIVIMVSDETEVQTINFLAANNNFKAAPGQIHFIKQDEFPGVIPSTLQIAKEGPYQLNMKPHGHGDIHLLLYQTGLSRKWEERGILNWAYLQDTNTNHFNALLPMMAITDDLGLDVNYNVTPRTPGQKIGAMMQLNHKGGRSSIGVACVEYSVLDGYLRQAGQDGDTGDPEMGNMSPFPGNTNTILFRVAAYNRMLDATEGVINEEAKVKPGDEDKPARPETQAQDASWGYGSDAKMGVTYAPDDNGDFVFRPAKESIEKAAAAWKTGNADNMGRAESTEYKNTAKILEAAGVNIDTSVETVLFHGAPFYKGTNVILSPKVGITLSEIASKFENVSIEKGSTLSLDGKSIRLRNVQIDGALIVHTADGVDLVIHDAKIETPKWEFKEMSARDIAQSPIDWMQIRGYNIIKSGGFDVHITEPGNYTATIEGNELVVRKAVYIRLRQIEPKSSSAGNEQTNGDSIARAKATAGSLINTQPSTLDSTMLDMVLTQYQQAITELEALKGGSPKTAEITNGPLKIAEASFDIMTLSKDIALEHAKIADEAGIRDISGTIIINDIDVPQNQRVLLELFDKDSVYLKALEEKIGCKIRLLSQFDASTDRSANMIAISKDSILSMPDVRRIDIDTVTSDAYLPLEQIVVFAKTLLPYNRDTKSQLDSIVSQAYRFLSKKPIDPRILSNFLDKAVFNLKLPQPAPVDEQYYENLHRQAMAALIAA